MAPKSAFRLYLRSRLNAIIAAGSGVVLVAGIALFPASALAAIGGAVLLYAAVTALVFFSRRGAAVVASQEEQTMRAANLAKVSEAEKLRERLSVMRFGDDEVRRAVELVLLVSGHYLEKARVKAAYSPQANDRIRQALQVCQAFLGELDETSTERRYGVADGDEGADMRTRSITALKECAAAIRRHSLNDLGGVDGAEALAVIEEMEERK